MKLKAEFRVPPTADPGTPKSAAYLLVADPDVSLSLSVATTATNAVKWRFITPKKEFEFECSTPEEKEDWFRSVRYTMEGTVPPVFVNVRAPARFRRRRRLRLVACKLTPTHCGSVYRARAGRLGSVCVAPSRGAHQVPGAQGSHAGRGRGGTVLSLIGTTRRYSHMILAYDYLSSVRMTSRSATGSPTTPTCASSRLVTGWSTMPSSSSMTRSSGAPRFAVLVASRLAATLALTHTALDLQFKPLSITIDDVEREAESGKFIVTDAKDMLGRPIVYFKTALDKTPFDDVRFKHMVFLLEEIAARADSARYATEKSVWFFDFTDRDFVRVPPDDETPPNPLLTSYLGAAAVLSLSLSLAVAVARSRNRTKSSRPSSARSSSSRPSRPTILRRSARCS